MSWTKRQLVEAAYAELAVCGWLYDLDPEEVQSALGRLDSMLALWDSKGIRLGYALSSTPDDADPDQLSGIPQFANEPVFLNLAKRIAASKGKQLTAQTLELAKQGYDWLLVQAAQPIEQQMPNTMPRGQGAKPWRTRNRPYMPQPDRSPLRAGENGDLDILPE